MRMGWGAAIGIAVLTALTGAATGGYLGSLCVAWYRISPREGGSGYFIMAMGLIGLAVGFLAGLITARLIPSGFWPAQGASIAVVLGLGLVVGFFARWNGEVPPELNGETVRLEVDLRCPPGWMPDNKARAGNNGVWLTPLSASHQRRDTVAGSAWLDTAPQPDGTWIAHSGVWLFSSRPIRIVHITLGDKVNLQIAVPLPTRLTPRQEQWSEWRSQEIAHGIGKPPIVDFAFRYRVRPVSAVQKEDDEEQTRAREAIENALAAVSPYAPLTEWLRFVERGNSGLINDSVPPRAIEIFNARAVDLEPLLRSPDRQVKMRAVFAAGLLRQIPPSLIQPLADAGELVLTLMQEAKAGAQQSDPDLTVGPRASGYFFKWSLTMQLAGAPAADSFRKVLLEIQWEADAERTGDVEMIGRYSKEYLKNLATAREP
jgi:hypothetical protein